MLSVIFDDCHMLNVTYELLMLSVIMLNEVMLSVVAPGRKCMSTANTLPYNGKKLITTTKILWYRPCWHFQITLSCPQSLWKVSCQIKKLKIK